MIFGEFTWKSEDGTPRTGKRAIAINPGDCGGVIDYDPCTTTSHWLMQHKISGALEWVDPAKLNPSPLKK